MTRVCPRVVFIGPEDAGESVVSNIKNIEFVAQLSNIESFWNRLENGVISNNIEIVIITDTFYDRFGDDDSFERLVAQLNPFCFVVVMSYHPLIEEEVREKVESKAKVISWPSGSFSQEYLYVNETDFSASFKDAVRQYIQTSNNKNIVEMLSNYALI